MFLSTATIALFPDGTIVIQLAIFLVVCGLVTRFLLRPLMRVRTLRHEATVGADAEAKRLEALAEGRLAEYERRVAEARQRGRDCIERLRQEGYAKAAEIMAGAKQAALDRLQQAKEQVAKEADHARCVLEQRADEFARAIMERLLERTAVGTVGTGERPPIPWSREGGKS